MPVLKDRVANLEYMIEKLQEELRKLKSIQEKEVEEDKPTITPNNARRRAAI